MKMKMNWNKPVKKPLIRNANLDPGNYFTALVEEAHRLGLLPDPQLERIRMQIIGLLSERTESYTLGASSSVRMETAQNILHSTLYTLGVRIKNLPEPDAAIPLLDQESLSDLYRQGREIIGSRIDIAQELLEAVRNQRVTTGNLEYNETIDNGIAVFFAEYDPDFAAHETPSSIDYPLCIEISGLTGIEYIGAYLQQLLIENQFCHHFASEEIESLLRGYDDHYQHLLINIFRLILTNLTGAALAEQNRLNLALTPSDYEYLREKLKGLPEAELDPLLEAAALRISGEFNVTGPLLRRYIAATIRDLAPQLKVALAQDQLEALFVPCKAKPAPPELQFHDAPKMDDDSFRTLTEEIRDCRYVTDKIALIEREIHSLADLVDLLEGDCIFGAEFPRVFASLGDMRLALLIKKLPARLVDSDFHLNGHAFAALQALNRDESLTNFHPTESEREWQLWLNRFFAEITPERRERIKALTEKIDLSEDF
jgi:hypothetical protein